MDLSVSASWVKWQSVSPSIITVALGGGAKVIFKERDREITQNCHKGGLTRGIKGVYNEQKCSGIDICARGVKRGISYYMCLGNFHLRSPPEAGETGSPIQAERLGRA
jgi:hypothetical protein